MAEEVQRERITCAFFLKRKNRFCRMTVSGGSKYCGEHRIFDEESKGVGRKRITCPLDGKHTVFEDQLKNHLKKCNQTKKTQVVYYSSNINSGIPDYEFSAAEKVSLSSVCQEKVSRLISKVKECYKAHVPQIPEEVLFHNVFQEEVTEMVDNPAVLKHLKQQASLIGHMDKLHLLEPRTIFLEFGAGRGKLSHWLQLAVGSAAKDVDYLLIDRASNRYKYDRYHRGEDQGPSFQRLNLDIRHLDLSKVPCIQYSKRRVVAVSKHLCGAATDLTIRCLVETLDNTQKQSVDDICLENGADKTRSREDKRIKLDPNERPVKGVILALCCHHCCSWPQYVGRPFLQNLGFTAEDFHLLCCLSSWATCGMRLRERRRGIAGRTDERTENDDRGGDDCHEISTENIASQEFLSKNDEDSKEIKEACEEDRWSNYTIPEREEIGLQCKRLLDTGRLWYLESREFNARLAFYVDSSVSLENAVLVATPNT
ncbi:tRNA:m(4)X modification enzyme TRM13-like [Stylophora pistillata]|uniref:tRNA:m(4)X modification enzyme TRM13 n=1 Tax=Stylophora pistillata TaxID=50429 RepID=A0A2B4S021_STYPI|nr:tRNA:m(4)X modification enzyme TRM13-like [Stylophora pistillata]